MAKPLQITACQKLRLADEIFNEPQKTSYNN